MKPIESLTLSELVDDQRVHNKFLSLYEAVHGRDGKNFYESEKFHFLKRIQESDKLQNCTKISLYGCFMDAAISGLSFDPSMKHCYLIPYGQKATMVISGYGELYLRQKNGQVKYADNPVLVYEGDEFSYGMVNGSAVVNHLAKLPRKSMNIIACYMKITRTDGTTDYKVMAIDEIMALRAFSKDPNSMAWTKGLAGMCQAKVIKHAFRTYPKFRMGANTVLETELPEAEEGVFDYTIAEEVTASDDPQTNYEPADNGINQEHNDHF